MPIFRDKRVVPTAGASSLSTAPVNTGPPPPQPAGVAPPLPPRLAPLDFNADTTPQLSSELLQLTASIVAAAASIAASVNSLSLDAERCLATCAEETGKFSEVLLQGTNFLEFQAASGLVCATKVLHHMEATDKSMTEARRLLDHIKSVNGSLNDVETIVAEMEKERGIVPPKPQKKGLLPF